MDFWDKHKTITNFYEKLTKEVCNKNNITQMEYNILMFLYNNPECKTASGIIEKRKSTKSHVSNSLKNLEKNKLIIRKQKGNNKKYIEIFLLEKSKVIINEGKNLQKKFINNLFEGISSDEMIIFKNIFYKICENADKHLKK